MRKSEDEVLSLYTKKDVQAIYLSILKKK